MMLLRRCPAGYVRFDQKIGDAFKVMAGLRVENTHVKYSGYNYDIDADKMTDTGNSTKTYTNILPSLLAKWEVNKQMNVRASFTNYVVASLDMSIWYLVQM